MQINNLIFKLCLFQIVLFIFSSNATFSICAIDSVTKEVGSAGASCIGTPQIPQGWY